MMVSVNEVMDLLHEQQFKCALTGVRLEPEVAVIDHKIPRSNGGDDEKPNLHVVHATVNRMKHTLSEEEFLSWCRLVVGHKAG